MLQKFLIDILATTLNVLHNYASSIKFRSVSKFLNISAKPFFLWQLYNKAF